MPLLSYRQFMELNYEIRLFKKHLIIVQISHYIQYIQYCNQYIQYSKTKIKQTLKHTQPRIKTATTTKNQSHFGLKEVTETPSRIYTSKICNAPGKI